MTREGGKSLIKPKEEWARLYADESEESSEALKLLRDSGYRVITFPIKGSMGPVLRLGTHEYNGIKEIKKLIIEEGK